MGYVDENMPRITYERMQSILHRTNNIHQFKAVIDRIQPYCDEIRPFYTYYYNLVNGDDSRYFLITINGNDGKVLYIDGDAEHPKVLKTFQGQ